MTERELESSFDVGLAEGGFLTNQRGGDISIFRYIQNEAQYFSRQINRFMIYSDGYYSSPEVLNLLFGTNFTSSHVI